MACKVCEDQKKFGGGFTSELLLCELISTLKCDGLFKEFVTKEAARWWKQHKRSTNHLKALY